MRLQRSKSPGKRQSRVLSFISQWSHPSQNNNTSPPNEPDQRASLHASDQLLQPPPKPPDVPPVEDGVYQPLERPRASSRSGSRPTSMVQNFQPPLMDVNYDTPKELQPIFSFLNSHSSKLYHEGYFLKLHDLDSRGAQRSDRRWQECFAQLVGTVLSVWDAAELDAAGEAGEVNPAFINLADASIKMIQSLPMESSGVLPLANVLSVSTAASNRYLFHFNSYNSLTQWTAAIRLAMFENTSLQEAYTGSLIAGKGKGLNNIRQIMERNRVKYEDWARVRFGAGNPWRRCWFVVTPPDEKEYQKMQKTMKKRNPYEKMPVLKGDLKFYESKRITKRTKPIATITDAFSAYAIYPQSKPLIDQSTLVKIEGRIAIHNQFESTTEGFVFVMPEIHPAISGFEMMLRFLFPVWDAFSLYGRPNRLVADSRDTRGLMFALPKDRRYGYLEGLDVAALINSEQSPAWAERDWRKQMKDLTAKRMLALAEGDGPTSSRATLSRSSLPIPHDNKLRYEDSPSGRSTPGLREPRRNTEQDLYHRRSQSEAAGDIGSGPRNEVGQAPTLQHESPPPPPPHHRSFRNEHSYNEQQDGRGSGGETGSQSSGERTPDRPLPPDVLALAESSPPPGPVGPPPAMSHRPSEKPTSRPPPRPANPDLDGATLSQLEEVSQRPLAYRQQPHHPNSREGQPQLNNQNQFNNQAHFNSQPQFRNQGQFNGQFSGHQGPYPEQGSWHHEEEHPTSVIQQHYQQPQPQYRTRQTATRLATIPASPYVDQLPSAASDSSNTYFPPSKPPIPEMASSEPPAAQRPNDGQISRAINRKPVRSTSGDRGPTSSGDGESSRAATPGDAGGSPASAHSASSLGGSSTVANVNGKSGVASPPTSHPQAPLHQPGDMRTTPQPLDPTQQGHEQATPLSPTSAPDPRPHPIPMNMGTQALDRKKSSPAAHGPPPHYPAGDVGPPPPIHGSSRGMMGPPPRGGFAPMMQHPPGNMQHGFAGQGPPMHGMQMPPPRGGSMAMAPPQGVSLPQGMTPSMRPPDGMPPPSMSYGLAGPSQGMQGPPQGMNVPPGGMPFAPAYHPIPGGQGPPPYSIPPHSTVYGTPRSAGPPAGPPHAGPPTQRSVTPPAFTRTGYVESTTPPGDPPRGVPLPPRRGTPLDFTKAGHLPQQAPAHHLPAQQSLSHQPSVGRPPAKQSPQQPMTLRSPMRSPQEQQQQQRQGDGQMLMYGGQLLPYDDVVQMKKRDKQMYGPQYVDTMERMNAASLFRGGATSPPAGEAVKRSESRKKWF